jgi:hypothetical protein
MVPTSSSVSPFFFDPGGLNSLLTPTAIGYAGEVIQGMDLVRAIEAKGSSSGNPSAKVVISNSGTV